MTHKEKSTGRWSTGVYDVTGKTIINQTTHNPALPARCPIAPDMQWWFSDGSILVMELVPASTGGCPTCGYGDEPAYVQYAYWIPADLQVEELKC